MSPVKPIHILVTEGDPAGIGPEIVARSAREWKRPADCALVGVGYPAHLERHGVRTDSFLKAGTELSALPPGVFWMTPGRPELDAAVEPARPTEAGGRAAIQCIEFAIQACMRGGADAICTGPIHKENLRMAGFNHPGHTELLAERAGADDVAMMLVGGGLRVVLATIHESLADVPRLLTRERLGRLIKLVTRAMVDFGFQTPRIGVAGLNPHAGEGGLFGREEIEIIGPAVEAARDEGMNVTGPLSADTIFHHQRRGMFDVTIAMYHDQGLIPVKTLDFDGGVNITLGLSFVRTSPDHGTAYDVAGKGIARTGSMMAALAAAYDLARRRRERAGEGPN